MQCSAHEPLYDIDPRDRRQHRSVLCRPRARNIRQVRRWLVLVVSPARLCARGLADRPVCYELRSLSPRDEYDGISPDPLSRDVTRKISAACFHIASTINPRGSIFLWEGRKCSCSN